MRSSEYYFRRFLEYRVNVHNLDGIGQLNLDIDLTYASRRKHAYIMNLKVVNLKNLTF